MSPAFPQASTPQNRTFCAILAMLCPKFLRPKCSGTATDQLHDADQLEFTRRSDGYPGRGPSAPCNLDTRNHKSREQIHMHPKPTHCHSDQEVTVKRSTALASEAPSGEHTPQSLMDCQQGKQQLHKHHDTTERALQKELGKIWVMVLLCHSSVDSPLVL